VALPSRVFTGRLSEISLVHGNLTVDWRLPDIPEGAPPLFHLQWLARTFERSPLRAFPHGSRHQLFINQSFFEQSRL
jgi:hypothetical protein